MTISKIFQIAAFAAFFFAAVVPATALTINRIARRYRRFGLAEDAHELGEELGLWFLTTGVVMTAAAVWWA